LLRKRSFVSYPRKDSIKFVQPYKAGENGIFLAVKHPNGSREAFGCIYRNYTLEPEKIYITAITSI